jgi:BlaI family penicillinase repressor
MNAQKLGQVQLKLMQLLWKMKRATARELTDEMNKTEPVAHSTVQTLLRQLEGKGSVSHEQDGRTFYFFPIVHEEKVKTSATRDLLRNVFQGSVGGLVAHLLEHEKIDPQELAEIRKLIEKKRKGV